jgi:hypothetical protein
VTDHGPVLPVWTCAGCDSPWPCPTRRGELLAEYDGAPVSLALYMGSHLVSATQDMSWAPAGALYRRFLGWLPRGVVGPGGELPGRSAHRLPINRGQWPGGES